MVKRYGWTDKGMIDLSCVLPGGPYVRFEDYDDLRALVSRLEFDHECEDPEYCRFCIATKAPRV